MKFRNFWPDQAKALISKEISREKGRYLCLKGPFWGQNGGFKACCLYNIRLTIKCTRPPSSAGDFGVMCKEINHNEF